MTAAVFLSHSSQDRTTAEAAATALERAGFRSWLAPRDITPGTSWGESIIAGIDGSRAVIVILSAAANASRQVARELERADSRGIPLVPFRIEDVTPSGAVEYFLGGHQWLDGFGETLEGRLNELVAAVARLLGQQPPPAPAKIDPKPPQADEISPDDWSRRPRGRGWRAPRDGR